MRRIGGSLVTFWRLWPDSSPLCLVLILLGLFLKILFIFHQTNKLLCWIVSCTAACPALPQILTSQTIKHGITTAALGSCQVKVHYKLLWEGLEFFPRTLVYSAINNRQPNSVLNHKEFIFHLTRKSSSKSAGVLMAQRCSLLPILSGWTFILVCSSWLQDGSLSSRPHLHT